MSEASAQSRANRKGRRLLARVLIGAAYLGIALLLVGWELQEQGDLYSSDRCDLRSAPQVENPLMEPLYRTILSHTTSGTSDRVSVVAIDSNLQVVQQNVCLARAFTADLIRAIAAQGAGVIAIDKFYGPTACPAEDKATSEFQAAVASLKIPLVVGESTHAPTSASSGSCLVLNSQLDLGSTIHRGLTRLNQDVLKLPLKWPILLHDSDVKPSTGPEGESFSLVAATQIDPTLRQNRNFNRLLDSPRQPYANVTGELESQTATNLLCSTAMPEVTARWHLDCTGHTAKINLHNKVVVVGAESESDYPSVLGEGMYGFNLQAHYIAAILSGSYLRQISPLFLLLPLAFYYILSELLIPFMHIHHHPPRPLFHIKHPLLWTIGVFAVTITIGLLLPLAFHRFPPLGILLGVCGILIPRLLIESWALLNERTEESSEGSK